MQYWIMKSEPTTYGIDHLIKCPKQSDYWEGVRNYQARNMMRDDMRPGDMAFFYHSNCDVPGIVGLMEITSEGYPDPTAFDPQSKYHDPKSDPDNPRWYLVDVHFKEKFDEIIPLSALRQEPKLANMLILRKGNRLSITPVTPQEWQTVLQMVSKK